MHTGRCPIAAPYSVMSLFSLLGALEIGLIFSLVALGVLISFRILNFPDLTVDGSFPMGGAVAVSYTHLRAHET